MRLGLWQFEKRRGVKELYATLSALNLSAGSMPKEILVQFTYDKVNKYELVSTPKNLKGRIFSWNYAVQFQDYTITIWNDSPEQ